MKHFESLACLFNYPDNQLSTRTDELKNLLGEHYPHCMDSILLFRQHLAEKSLEEQQEQYIKTFDVQASCYLDIGYILFGEDYKRGEFLVNIAKEHKKINNDCGSELADHLPNLLNLLARTPDVKFAEELGYCLIIPALKEMIKTFVDKNNIYKIVVEMLLSIMEKDFDKLSYNQFKISPEVKSCFTGKGNYKAQLCGQKM